MQRARCVSVFSCLGSTPFDSVTQVRAYGVYRVKLTGRSLPDASLSILEGGLELCCIASSCSMCLLQMQDYCTNTKDCRHLLLLAYFGEHFAAGQCGGCCDNCVARQSGGAPDDDIWLVRCHGQFCQLSDSAPERLHGDGVHTAPATPQKLLYPARWHAEAHINCIDVLNAVHASESCHAGWRGGRAWAWQEQKEV